MSNTINADQLKILLDPVVNKAMNSEVLAEQEIYSAIPFLNTGSFELYKYYRQKKDLTKWRS